MTVDQLLEPAPVSAPPRRGRWLLALVLLVVFVSGGIVGGGSTDYVHRNGWMRLMRSPSEVPDRLVPMLRGKLDLSEEQTAKVDQVVRQRHREIEKLRAEVQPRIDRQIEQMQSEIDAVLDPGQRDRWHEWVQSLQHRWGPDHRPRHHGSRPPHGSAPGHEGETGWRERHSGHSKSKDWPGRKDLPASAVEKTAAETGSVEKPADQKSTTEKAAEETPTRAAAAAKDASAEVEKSIAPPGASAQSGSPASSGSAAPSDSPAESTVPPAKTDP
jgi:hypothetical protein